MCAMLINGRMLETAIALQKTDHPLHEIAKEYTEGLKQLREQFPDGKIKFVRPGFPRKTKGVDARGREVMMVEPAIPALFPLEKKYSHPMRGEEIWSCCLQMPKLLPNGLWSIGGKKSLKVDDFYIVDLNRQPDLAYYLAYIAKYDRKGLLKIDDPKAEVRKKAAEERRMVEIKTAIWQMLSDDEQLRKMAAAYGVNGAHTKHNGGYAKDADQLRFELEDQILKNEKRRGKNDFSVKGISEFLEEMKVTDNVRLRAFIQNLIDEKKIVYKPDGRFRVGEKAITQVPQSEIGRKFEWLCSFYAMPSNKDRLVELMKDVIDKEYLDNISDDKDFTWIAKTLDINTAFKKKEELKSTVYGAFNVVP